MFFIAVKGNSDCFFGYNHHSSKNIFHIYVIHIIIEYTEEKKHFILNGKKCIIFFPLLPYPLNYKIFIFPFGSIKVQPGGGISHWGGGGMGILHFFLHIQFLNSAHTFRGITQGVQKKYLHFVEKSKHSP